MFMKEKNCNFGKLLKVLFPILVWLPQYSMHKFRGDLVAGITCGIIAIPQSIAFATLAGLPPEYGLYVSLTPGLIYCILGTSKNVSVGASISLALYCYRFNPTHHPIGASLLSFLTGLILVLMGIFQISFIIRYVPQLVISAFVSAAAFIVLVTQLPNIMGIKNAPENVFMNFIYVLKNIKSTNTWDLTIGSSCFVFLTFFTWVSSKNWKPSSSKYLKTKAFLKKLIWFLTTAQIALICLLATAAVYIICKKKVTDKISIAGKLPSGLPAITNPFQSVKVGNHSVTTKDFMEDFGLSLIVLPTFIFIEQISIARTFAPKFGYNIDTRQELIAIGMCNIVATFFGGWPTGSSFSRSAVNYMSGAQTPFAGVVSSALVLIAVQYLTPALFFIPRAALGATMIISMLKLTDMSITKNIWKLHKLDLIPYTVAFCLSFYRLEYAVLAGSGISIIILLSQESRPLHCLEKHDNGKFVTVKLIESLTYPGLYDINKLTYSLLENNSEIKVLYFDMGNVQQTDYSILKNFQSLQQELSLISVKLIFVKFSDNKVKFLFLNAGLSVENEEEYIQNCKNEA